MRHARNLCTAFLIFVFANAAFAQAQPAYNGRMNAAIGSIIKHKIAQWGFAANDPRFQATLTAVGVGATSAATVAAGAAVGGAAAVSWPALLISAGITGLISGAISLAQDSDYSWTFNPDNTVTVPPILISVPDPSGIYKPTSGGSCTNTEVFSWCPPYNSFTACVKPGDLNPTLACSSNWASYGFPRQATNDAEAMGFGGYSIPGTTTSTLPQPLPIGDAIAAVPPEELPKPVSPALLAQAANAIWRAMQPDPEAIPAPLSDPITPADVTSWQSLNPLPYPTLADALAPVAPADSSSPAVSLDSPTLAPGPAPSPGEGTKVDLGTNPNIPPPGLENIPTAKQIMDPLLDLMPELADYEAPAHVGQCPTGSFSFAGQSFSISSHCTLLESNRALIESFMLLVWALGSVFIVLRA